MNSPFTPNPLSAQQPQPTTTAPQADRLATARNRLSAVCAEYNHFNPTFYITNPRSSLYSHLDERSSNEKVEPPNAEQMKRDLQKLFERFNALASPDADEVYMRMSLEARDMANDEYSGFDWEMFQDVVVEGLRDLRNIGVVVEVEDLVTLPRVATLLRASNA